jgi:hypothetical protein
MADAPIERWHCPTRADGSDALIEQSITRLQCQKRQREHYHKCPTCEHRNGAPVRRPMRPGVVVEPEGAVEAPAQPSTSPAPLAG